jgi:hypothetical protein
MSNQLGYDARSVSGQTAQKSLRHGFSMAYDATKWFISFLGDLWKTFLAK